MTISIKQAKAFAAEQGLDSLDSDVLLANCLQKDRSFLFTWPEQILSKPQEIVFRNWVAERAEGKPVAYILGFKEFWSMPIKTNSATLIPRPDTEVLVETVLNNHRAAALCCVDLGTGTGAIALALKAERTNWKVIGIDRIVEAVELARENAELLTLDVDFKLGNWCDSLAPNSADVIVSNPPYIDADDKHLKQGDVRFEPTTALVANESGLADIHEIARQSKSIFKSEGWLYLEHGWDQGPAAQEVLADNGFSNIKTVKDYGENDRVTYGCYTK